MNAYEQKQEIKKERLQGKIDKLRISAQPILVGHHSEGRDRNFRKRIENNFIKSYELQKEAKETERRMQAVGTGGISSDDPDAIEKLKEKLKLMQEKHAANYFPQNALQNMRSVKLRIEQLEKRVGQVTEEIDYCGIFVIKKDVEANRLKLEFKEKPDSETRAILKSHGFKWSPTSGAWQRKLNGFAIAAVEYVKHSISKEEKGV